MSGGYILDVQHVTRDGGDYAVRCPHCGDIIGIDGADMSEIRGEQYQHRRREWQGPRGMKSVGCDGWMQIADNARFVRELPRPAAAPTAQPPQEA